MWIAKNDYTGKTYGKKFSSIYDCDSYIENELKDVEKLTLQLFILENEKQDMICFKSNNFIRPYNVNQKRFAHSFDF